MSDRMDSYNLVEAFMTPCVKLRLFSRRAELAALYICVRRVMKHTIWPTTLKTI